ncbi:MAG: HIT family protein [bacterium]
MDDCLFCRIAAGNLPSAELYQDERVFAFLDIHPLRPGHTLLVPKRHTAKLEDASPEDAAALIAAARRLTKALGKATGATDATLAIHNGPAAGQEVQHLHMHIVPRTKGDGGGPIHAAFKGTTTAASEDLHDLAIKVQRIVGGN